jgi:hypothetical protein
MSMFFYDEESDAYLPLTLDFNCRSLSSVQVGSHKLHQIELSLTPEALKELKMDESQLIADTLYFESKGGDLRMMSDVALAEPLVHEWQTYDFATIYERGTFDINSLDKAKTKEFIASLKEDAEEKQNARKARTRASSSGRNMSEWMKDIPGDTKVRDLLLPGSHDCGTHGMRNPNGYTSQYMTTFGKTQLLDLSDQFAWGSRVFDLRARYVSKKEASDTYIFHDLFYCDVTLEQELKSIKKCLENHDSEGVIITIKGEDNVVANFMDDRAKEVEEKFSGYGITTQLLLSAFLNDCFKDAILFNIDYSDLDKNVTTYQTMLLVRDILYESGKLAKFDPDMTMDDLRGKALVILQDYDYPDGRLGDIDQYIALTKGDKYVSADGKVSVGVASQNDWDQEDNQTEDAYVESKNKQFKEMLTDCNNEKNAGKWIVNACNGYFRDGGINIPDYITYASRVYPVMAANVEATPGSRGICIQDYVGCEQVTHVPFFGIITFWNSWVDLGGLIWAGLTGDITKFLKVFNYCYWAAVEDTPQRNTYSRQLTEAMVERNFTNSDEARAAARKIVATSGTFTKGKAHESYNQLFDGNLQTKWCVNKKDKDWDGVMIKGDECWGVEFQTVAPVSPVGFTLYTGNDTSVFPKRNPKKWGLVGKLNKDDKWTHIAWYESSTKSIPKTNCTPVYMPLNGSKIPPKMQYFRFEVYSNLGDDCIQFSEFEFNY